MKSFTHSITVKQDDIDELGHVNNVVYVRWVQEVAAAHWEMISSKELKQNFLWVVLRHEIDYKNPSFLDDEITGITWVGDNNGARFERFVKLTSKGNGKVVAEAKTTWCLLEKRSMKPIRIPESILSIL